MRRKLWGSWQLYVCLLPAFLYLIVMNYAPMYGVQIAFRNYVAKKGIWGSEWVGLRHFNTFVHSVQFPVLIRNTLLLSLYSLLIGFPINILLALMLHEVKCVPFKKLVQNATYIPHFISIVVLVAMISNFTSPSIGFINKFIVALGGSPIDFMGDSKWFRTVYIASDIWQNSGWNSIIYIAALSGIDPQLYEAASIDGANRFQRILHINIPGILPTIVMLLILNCGSILSVGYEKAFLMQNTLNSDVSEIISTYVYKIGLQGSKYSYSAAIGLFNSVINFGILLSVNAISKRLSNITLI
ncbi:MAG: ABC transporter permease subunit [Eubacteriales bacterium]|nr:ABC transporter permease subunit [Eubacteriales bacterium]